jgi:chromatin assembly factor 1 subunit B
MLYDGVLEVCHTASVGLFHLLTRTGEMLATAGDDGNVLLWVPSENPAHNSTFGEDAIEDVETWRVKTMCRSSSGSEIYDLAWSPDGMFFITGSMDNVARIYSATNGKPWQNIGDRPWTDEKQVPLFDRSQSTTTMCKASPGTL